MTFLPGFDPLAGTPQERSFERFTDMEDFRGAPARLLDIPETIPSLGYASHQFFRYYGKFPSLVGAEILGRFASSGRSVLDNYSGSGTTQVEAQMRGLTSFGIDINPLAVLAANAKTSYVDRSRLAAAFSLVMSRLSAAETVLFELPVAPERANKWFTQEAQDGLGRLRASIDLLPSGLEKQLLITCFLAVVRRVSNAYDGEVRPHVNRTKKPRDAIKAFARKYAEIVSGLTQLDEMRRPGVRSQTVIGDNRSDSAYSMLASEPAGLVVSHPPYLNSFNYLAVFSLEFMWAEGIPEVWGDWSRAKINALEQKAHPATDPRLVATYYESIKSAAAQASQVMIPGGVLAMVIGDATIYGLLEPVHERIWEGLDSERFEPTEIWFRTTHYGIGKYAYSGRADYHGAAEKKDAIMFFRKRR